MTLLDNHLEQISLSSAAIAELPFPSPKIFTNALLHCGDITSLIRDTESHERALFTLAPPDQLPGVPDAALPPHRKGQLPRRQNPASAVATLLGGDLGEQVRKDRVGGEVDVGALLQGAEKLCAVYPIAGASERIAQLKARFEQSRVSVDRFEERVKKQSTQLARMSRQRNEDEEDDDDSNGETEPQSSRETANDKDEDTPDLPITDADLRKEQEEIEELERRKKVLEDRVAGMERDLGGLLR